jgi:hypothetical protein
MAGYAIVLKNDAPTDQGLGHFTIEDLVTVLSRREANRHPEEDQDSPEQKWHNPAHYFTSMVMCI